MPLLITDFPPYARPKPKLDQDSDQPLAREKIAQGVAARELLDELERALVCMLFLLEQRPEKVQPLRGAGRVVWWQDVIRELGWDRHRFQEAVNTLRGGSFVGYEDGHAQGLTRRGMREALLLRKEGVEPWARPQPKIVSRKVVVGIDPGVDGKHFGVVTEVGDDGTITVQTSGVVDIPQASSHFFTDPAGKVIAGPVAIQAGDSVTFTQRVTLD